MKLLKSEKCALIITIVFLALTLGFSLGRHQQESVFIVTESAFSSHGSQSAAENGAPSSAAVESERTIININSCTAAELEALPGIGPVLAERIIAYRESEGGFKTIEDITKVQGIGAAVYEDIREYISVE